ncbi:hypothetical protein PTT_20185 [Pyrenophora teres f. teres 0-1]|uniref:Uncharacterized protein n=1 Tax=Pyrenophora teres f. teres (strain 0-1) TaxID=861557 RepID=E3SAI4_PYRTT|nr:hypothetical protein PTT_20185 [Pyrenophora teres f. teres 0-1]
MCEDATLIKRWFKLVEEIKAEQGIYDKDVYNFDKASFIIGKITTQLRWWLVSATVPHLRWSVPPISVV